MPAEKLGTFKVETGKVYVCDPCYGKGDSLGYLADAVNGVWKATARITKNEGRVSVLTAKSSEAKDGGEWTKLRTACVDSGQMSIFDFDFFKKESEGKGKCSKSWQYMEDEDDGAFYGACCSLTCGESNGVGMHGGVLEHGAVSSTGWGDGCYPVFVKKNKTGKVVAVKVKFM